MSEHQPPSTSAAGRNGHDDPRPLLEELRDAPTDLAADALIDDVLKRARLKDADADNARRFVLDHANTARFAPGAGWHLWDGRRFAPDDDGGVMRLAKQSARAIVREVDALTRLAQSEAETAGDDKAAAKRAASRVTSRLKWGLTSLQRPRLEAMVELAKSEAELIVRVDDLDSDPMLINVLNGCIDLRTGTLLPHDPGYLQTKLAGATYDPEAESQRWVKFLRDATGGDDNLAAYLQRVAGYLLTGRTDEEVLFFAHGPSATGKTTLLEALKQMLGEYACTASFGTFLERRDHGPRNDLARLAGARMVASSEVKGGTRFDAETVKAITGGDTITARYLYREAFEYRPSFKVTLAANERPEIAHDDDALWRRVHCVPFTQVVPVDRRDPELKLALRNDPRELSAILTWAVKGALDWQNGGLRPPECVRDYTSAYRNDQDPLREWLEDCATLDNDAVTTRTELRGAYETWCQRTGTDALRPAELGNALRGHGVTQGPTRRGVRTWKGIAITGVHGA